MAVCSFLGVNMEIFGLLYIIIYFQLIFLVKSQHNRQESTKLPRNLFLFTNK
jgi:hypothetical protein